MDTFSQNDIKGDSLIIIVDINILYIFLIITIRLQNLSTKNIYKILYFVSASRSTACYHFLNLFLCMTISVLI